MRSVHRTEQGGAGITSQQFRDCIACINGENFAPFNVTAVDIKIRVGDVAGRNRFCNLMTDGDSMPQMAYLGRQVLLHNVPKWERREHCPKLGPFASYTEMHIITHT
jgi:hypothetical protein